MRYVFVSVCLYVLHVSAGALGDQKRVSRSLEQELEFILRHLMWVLNPKSWSSPRAASVLIHIVISLEFLN